MIVVASSSTAIFLALTGLELALEAAKTGSFYGDREVGAPTPLQRAQESDRILKKAFSAHVLDLGEGGLGFEFHTKMNALDDSVVNELSDALDLMESRDDVTGMVIANDGQNFSVGANIMLILMSINQQAWDQVAAMSKRFQDVFRRMHKSSKPVVAAPHNMALGGGAEICLGADRVRAHAELYMGLVEVGVGLIPGAGGTLELLKRHVEEVPVERDIVFDRLPWVARTFMAIGTAKVATSAVLSSPPERNTPSGTSAIKRRSTAVSRAAHKAASASAGVSRGGWDRGTELNALSVVSPACQRST